MLAEALVVAVLKANAQLSLHALTLLVRRVGCRRFCVDWRTSPYKDAGASLLATYGQRLMARMNHTLARPHFHTPGASRL